MSAERQGVEVLLGSETEGYFIIAEVELLDLHRVPGYIADLLAGDEPALLTGELVRPADGGKPRYWVTIEDEDDDDDFGDAFVYTFPAGLTLVDPFLGTGR